MVLPCRIHKEVKTLKSKRLFFILWVLFALMLAVGCNGGNAAADGSNMLNNPTFANADSRGVPEDWQVVSYAGEGYSVQASEGVVTLTAAYPDDLRLIQTIDVKQKTRYILSALVSTVDVCDGQGANLSIDNIDIDNSCITSLTSLYADNDWMPIELAFETVADQTQVNIALRLGYYGGTSYGTAQFKEVSLTEAGDREGNFITLNSWSTSSSDSPTKSDAAYEGYFAAMLSISVLCAVALIVGIYCNRERISQLMGDGRMLALSVVLIITLGTVVRLALTAGFGGHSYDISCWRAWGSTVANNGLSQFYANSWCDYPPAYLMVCGVLSRISQGLGLQMGSVIETFLYMLPAFLADIGIALVALRLCKRFNRSFGFSLMMVFLIVLNPALTFLSGAWSQIDSILTLFLLLSFVFTMDEKRILGGVMFGLAICFKWQALMFGPVLAACYLLSIKKPRQLIFTVLGVLAALVTMLLISLPMKPQSEPLYYMVQRFISSAGGYDYASIEAYNFMSLIKGNWTPAGTAIIGPVSYKVFGTIMIGLFVAISIGLVCYLRWGRGNLGKGNIFNFKGELLAIAAFSMYGIYTFGHYMHERYVIPAILFIMLGYVFTKDGRLLLGGILLSCVALFNIMVAQYVLSPGASDVVRGGQLHNDMIRLCSMLEVASFGYYAYAVARLLKFGQLISRKGESE